jgi:hypothetical protein
MKRIFKDTIIFKDSVEVQGDLYIEGDLSVKGNIIKVNTEEQTRIVYKDKVIKTKWDMILSLFKRYK